jgi:hypothetical protein
MNNIAKTPFRSHCISLIFNQIIRLAQAQIKTYGSKSLFAFVLTDSGRSHSFGAKSQNQEFRLPGVSLKKAPSARMTSYYRDSRPKSILTGGKDAIDPLRQVKGVLIERRPIIIHGALRSSSWK